MSPISGKAFITGASGFVGSHLKDELLQQKVDVITIRRPASPAPKEEIGRSVVAEYDDLESLIALMEEEQPDYVFHVAGVTKGVTYGDFYRGNVMPTKNLLESVKKANLRVRRFVQMSSLTSYGPSGIEQPHDEQTERNPIEYYGRSKLEAEQAVESSDVPYTILRPGGVYGPRDGDYFQLFKSINKGWNVFFGNRRRYFSVVYVEDLVTATLQAATSDTTINKGYFICDGKPISWGDFQQCIVEKHGKKTRDLDLPEFFVSIAAFGGELLTGIDGKPRLFNRQKSIMGKQDAWTCSHRAAHEDFGYTPANDLESGITKTLDWYKAEGWL